MDILCDWGWECGDCTFPSVVNALCVLIWCDCDVSWTWSTNSNVGSIYLRYVGFSMLENGHSFNPVKIEELFLVYNWYMEDEIEGVIE